MKFLKFSILFLCAGLVFTACDDDDDIDVDGLELDINGLTDLGPDYIYEGWLIIDGSPQSTGTFTADADGDLSLVSFPVDDDDLQRATAFVVTIEPFPDNDPAPSDVHYLAGDFDGDDAELRISHSRAIGTDFSDVAGTYILATPTNGPNTNELSGVWWLSPPEGPAASLELPELGPGWQYEGWAVINGTPVTTGKFNTPAGSDKFDGYSSTMPAPPFPGEDFLVNAPTGLTFPTDLSGMMVVITVEPSPDNRPEPFVLKPLTADVPDDADDHQDYTMSENIANTAPTGVVRR